MPLPWLKLWTETIHDTKIRRLPTGQRWCWIGVLCLAQESEQNGKLEMSGEPLTDEVIADACGVDMATWNTARSYFLRANMLIEEDGSLVVVNWNKRQGPADPTAAERMWRFRNKGSNVTPDVDRNVTRNVTRNSDADVTRRGQKKEDRGEMLDEREQRPETPATTAAAVKAYENSIGLISGAMQREEILAAIDILASIGHPEWWGMALRIAEDNDARKWSYVRAIITRCVKDGRAPGSTKPARRNGTGAPQTAEERRAKYIPAGYEDLVEH